MDTLFSYINALASGLISLALLGAILSKRVHDGVIIKVGLICLMAGFGAIALMMVGGIMPHHILGLERALLLINAGIAVVILGYLLRKAKLHHQVRRASDWSALDTQPMERAE